MLGAGRRGIVEEVVEIEDSMPLCIREKTTAGRESKVRRRLKRRGRPVEGGALNSHGLSRDRCLGSLRDFVRQPRDLFLLTCCSQRH